MEIGLLLVYLFCGIAILGGTVVLMAKTLLNAAMGLFGTLLAIAGLFALAGADFVATAQIMVYAGGVMFLLVFGFMLTSERKGNTLPATSFNRFQVGFILVLAAFTIGLAVVQTNWSALPWISKGIDKPFPASTLAQTGINLFTSYLLPFELVGFLLLLGLVGAGYFASKEKDVSE